MLLPDSVLRSVLRCTVEESPEAIEEHLRALTRETRLDGVDGYILTHMAHMLDVAHEVPTFQQVRDWAARQEARGDATASAALARLDGVESSDFLPTVDFRYALDAFKDHLLRDGVSAALLEATTVMSTGLPRQERVPGGGFKQVTLRGPLDAIGLMQQRLSDLTRQVGSGSIDGEFRSDIEAFGRELAKRANNPQRSGVLSGVAGVDNLHGGLQPGQLALIMGFTSHMKSTWALNWAYRAAVHQGLNVGVVSLEMSKFSVQVVLALLHCGHPKFDDRRAKYPVTGDKIRFNTLSDGEQKFLKDVLEDLRTDDTYGRIFYREPQSAITVADIQRWAEKLHRETPLSLLLIDYLGLVDPGTGRAGLEMSSSLNMVLRQSKLLAQAFDNGRGIPILSPFQANREGLKEAEKNNGRYKLTALAWANEAERSSDFVYYVYLDEALRAANELVIGNLKARDSAVLTEQIRVFADPATRRIEDLSGGAASAGALVDL